MFFVFIAGEVDFKPSLINFNTSGSYILAIHQTSFTSGFIYACTIVPTT